MRAGRTSLGIFLLLAGVALVETAPGNGQDILIPPTSTPTPGSTTVIITPVPVPLFDPVEEGTPIPSPTPDSVPTTAVPLPNAPVFDGAIAPPATGGEAGSPVPTAPVILGGPGQRGTYEVFEPTAPGTPTPTPVATDPVPLTGPGQTVLPPSAGDTPPPLPGADPSPPSGGTVAPPSGPSGSPGTSLGPSQASPTPTPPSGPGASTNPDDPGAPAPEEAGDPADTPEEPAGPAANSSQQGDPHPDDRDRPRSDPHDMQDTYRASEIGDSVRRDAEFSGEDGPVIIPSRGPRPQAPDLANDIDALGRWMGGGSGVPTNGGGDGFIPGGETFLPPGKAPPMVPTAGGNPGPTGTTPGTPTGGSCDEASRGAESGDVNRTAEETGQQPASMQDRDYDRGFGRDGAVTNAGSNQHGIDAQKSRTACTVDAQCNSSIGAACAGTRPKGSVCIPTWWGIEHDEQCVSPDETGNR